MKWFRIFLTKLSNPLNCGFIIEKRIKLEPEDVVNANEHLELDYTSILEPSNFQPISSCSYPVHVSPSTSSSTISYYGPSSSTNALYDTGAVAQMSWQPFGIIASQSDLPTFYVDETSSAWNSGLPGFNTFFN